MTGRSERTLIALMTAAVMLGIGQSVKGYVIERRSLRVAQDRMQRARRLIAAAPAMWRAIQVGDTSDSAARFLLRATRSASATTELASKVLAQAPEGLTDVPQVIAEADTTTLDGLRKGRVRVRATGSTENIVEFVARLLASNTLVRIDELRLELVGQATNATTDAVLSMELVASAWYRERA